MVLLLLLLLSLFLQRVNISLELITFYKLNIALFQILCELINHLHSGVRLLISTK